MRLDNEGKSDSASFFAGMAVGAYEAVGPLDSDLRYDYGRMAEVSGDLALAQAQVDTILTFAPNHLLGLVLGIRVARQRGDAALVSRLQARLRLNQQAELAKNLPEYDRHRAEIEAAVAQNKPAR